MRKDEKLMPKQYAGLRVFAEQIRVTTLEEFNYLGFGHIGGAMSVVETLAVLYGEVMNYDPKNPAMPDRDWLVMSKGHAGPALYACLALKGFFPTDMLLELNQGGGRLPSHCDRLKTPGIDMTTGSLGQGISTAIGVALGNRLDERANTVYFILGDGECNEGQVWEGAMLAPHLKLDNLVGFVDLNKQQLDGLTDEVLNMGDMEKKWNSFGWNTVKVNGHDVGEIYEAVMSAKSVKGKPTMIILDTVKGYGCSLTEGTINHHINFKSEDMAPALEAARKKLEEAQIAAAKGGAKSV